MEQKTAIINLIGSANGTVQYEVTYRGEVLHTEKFDNSDPRGSVTTANARKAARAAESWALSNGFTRVKWG